jgi:hypothetical protein
VVDSGTISPVDNRQIGEALKAKSVEFHVVPCAPAPAPLILRGASTFVVGRIGLMLGSGKLQ